MWLNTIIMVHFHNSKFCPPFSLGVFHEHPDFTRTANILTSQSSLLMSQNNGILPNKISKGVKIRYNGT